MRFRRTACFTARIRFRRASIRIPEISRQLSLWNQMGSKVILGNLIVIPVQDSLLYVEPLYIRAENGQLPELQRVIASYGDQVVMGDTLPETLASLFTGREGAARSGGGGDQITGSRLRRARRAPPAQASSSVGGESLQSRAQGVECGQLDRVRNRDAAVGSGSRTKSRSRVALGFRWRKVPAIGSGSSSRMTIGCFAIC